jgi:hypothetical protein
MTSHHQPIDPSVLNGFHVLASAIRTSADNLRMAAAEAILEREDGKAQAWLSASACFDKAAADVEAIRLKLAEERPTPPMTATEPESLNPHSKRAGSEMRVRLDGHAVEGRNAAEVFGRSIEAIGFDRVAALGMTLSGIALVGEAKTTSYQNQLFMGGRYICTHSNTEKKKWILEEIARRLRLSLAVCLDEGERPLLGVACN